MLLEKVANSASSAISATCQKRSNVSNAVKNCDVLKQGSSNYVSRAKSGPRSHFIRPQRHFVNNEKIMFLRNVCSFGRT